MASGDRIMITRAKIGRIADAIRERAEVSGGIELDDMPDLIRNISGGGGGGGEVVTIMDPLVTSGASIINSETLSITNVTPLS